MWSFLPFFHYTHLCNSLFCVRFFYFNSYFLIYLNFQFSSATYYYFSDQIIEVAFYDIPIFFSYFGLLIYVMSHDCFCLFPVAYTEISPTFFSLVFLKGRLGLFVLRFYFCI